MDIHFKIKCLFGLGICWFFVAIFLSMAIADGKDEFNKFIKHDKYYNLYKCLSIIALLLFYLITPVIIVLRIICML